MEYLLVFRVLHACACFCFMQLARNLWYHRRHPEEGMEFKYIDVEVKMQVEITQAADGTGEEHVHMNELNIELQDGADQGMSVDTIAIVASVLVGAAGYLVQAYTARRAEQSTAAQAQELHLQEQTRQREHEQMLSQIARADRWLDDCAPFDASVL